MTVGSATKLATSLTFLQQARHPACKPTSLTHCSLWRLQANMVGLLRSWQRMGGLTSRAVDTWGAAPAFSRSHRTIAYAVDAAATTVRCF